MPDVGRSPRRFAHEFLEIGLRVGEVERARHLQEVETHRLRGPCEPDQLGVLVVWPPNASGTLPFASSATVSADFYSLLEGHGREVARRTAGEQRRIFFRQSVAEQEPHVGAQRLAIHRKPRLVAKGRGNRDITAFETGFQQLRIQRHTPAKGTNRTGLGQTDH